MYYEVNLSCYAMAQTLYSILGAHSFHWGHGRLMHKYINVEVSISSAIVRCPWLCLWKGYLAMAPLWHQRKKDRACAS